MTNLVIIVIKRFMHLISYTDREADKQSNFLFAIQVTPLLKLESLSFFT